MIIEPVTNTISKLSREILIIKTIVIKLQSLTIIISPLLMVKKTNIQKCFMLIPYIPHQPLIINPWLPYIANQITSPIRTLMQVITLRNLLSVLKKAIVPVKVLVKQIISS